MDRLDIILLELLQKNSRITISELSKQLALSRPSISERILRLEHKIFPYAIRLYSEGRLYADGRTIKIKGYELKDEFFINPPIHR